MKGERCLFPQVHLCLNSRALRGVNSFRHYFGLQASLRQNHINHETRHETVDGRRLEIADYISRQMEEWQDADNETNCPSAVARNVDSFARAGPFATGER